MNVDGLVQTVVRFVGETPPPVPPVPDEPTNPEFIGAQTGDPLFWILFGTLIAVVVACGVAFYLYRKRVLAGNVSAAHAQEFNPLKNTKLMFISAIVFLFVVFCCVFASQAISANASTSYNISVETPQVITATVSDEEGIVFDNLDGDNTSYIKNTDSNTLNYCYTKVESDIEGLEGVNWNITVGDNVFDLPAGESFMFNTAVPAGETLHVNISTDMTTEQAKELCDKDVIKITYGILDTYCMDTTTMGSFVTSAENSVYSGRQTSAALNNLYDSDFVKQMTKMCYWGYSDAIDAGLGFYTIAELMSPETVAGGTIGENGKLRAIDQFDASQADGDQNLLEEEWNAYYDAVAKCNYTNQFAELLDTNSYDSQKAEAITLRCCCYYDLLRLFENIPYVTTGELVGPATQDKPLDVCKSLVEDLKLAEQSLPAVNDSIEQLSIPAAQAMTAKVFMLMVNFGDTTRYPEAEEYALKVINGSHKLTTKSTPRDISAFERRFALPSDYWGEGEAAGQKEGSDSISALTQNFIGEDSSIVATENEIIFTQRSDSPVKNRTWQNNLGMKNYGVSPYASGSGYLMVNDRYFDTLLAGPSWPPFDQCCAGAAGDDRGYESTTLYINGGPEKQPNKLIDEEGQTPPGYKEWAGYTGYISEKYAPLCTTSSSQPQYYPNYVVCDVAEMYLICAESNLEAGQTVPATSYVNVLERRAGAREYSSITKDDIFNVYTKEFMNEGVNFWASLRLKGLDWTAKQKVETENGTYKNGDFIAISEENIVKKQGLMQIPLSAITKYGLDQNPGW